MSRFGFADALTISKINIFFFSIVFLSEVYYLFLIIPRSEILKAVSVRGEESIQQRDREN